MWLIKLSKRIHKKRLGQIVLVFFSVHILPFDH